MRIEWAMACDGARATPSGQPEALGHPIDTTWLDEFPDDEFSIDVTLCLVSENAPDGGTTSMMRYVVTQASRFVAQLEFPVPITVFNDNAWPAEEPIRCWSVLNVRFPVAQPGLFNVAFSLDDQEPVILRHLVKRDE
jgi:hypothetical protein